MTIKTTQVCFLYIWLCVGLVSPAFAESSKLPNNFTPSKDLYSEDGSKCNYSTVTTDFLVCVREDRYIIGGLSHAEISRDLYKKSPPESLGRMDAKINWTIDKNGGCSMFVKTIIILPKLAENLNIDPDALEKWKHFDSILTQHEYNHHRFAIEGAWAEFVNGCPDPDKANSKILKRHKDYDQKTNHGVKEGARF